MLQPTLTLRAEGIKRLQQPLVVLPPLHRSRPANTLPGSPASGLCSLGWEASLGLSIKFVILSEVSRRRTQSKDLRFVRGRAEARAPGERSLLAGVGNAARSPAAVVPSVSV